MAKIFIFKSDGNNDRVKQGLYQALKSLDLTKPKQVTITDYKEDKTGEQRSWFHILCKLFGNELGYTQEQMKRVILVEVFGTEEVLGVKIAKSSESLKRDDYSLLIEQTYQIASENGVILPPPRIRGE